MALRLVSLIVSAHIVQYNGQECTQAAYIQHTAGFMLQNHTLESEIDARNYLGCATNCNRVLECVSFNWHDVDRVCMINNATKADFPVDYITKSGWSYYDHHEEIGHECDDGYCDGYQCEHTCPSGVRLGTPICYDMENPVILNMPTDITQMTQSSSSTNAVVTWTPPTATDNSGSQTLTSSHNSGDTFPIGVTIVTYTSKDAAGNEDTKMFTLNVEAPVPSPNNCIGRCGTYTLDDVCFCDEYCVLEGDCCVDFGLECGL